MNFTELTIPDVVLIEPQIYKDLRGYFFESFHQKKFCEAIKRNVTFLQDNESFSSFGVLRGLHYQIKKPQGKLVRVTHGEVFDVAVDLRKNSPTFGKWVGEFLNAENKKQLWIPEGFAHGFLVTSQQATVEYKVTEYWQPEFERCIRFDDLQLNINWPKLKNISLDEMKLSKNDLNGSHLKNAEIF